MTHRHKIDAEDQKLQDIEGSTLPFGGIAVLFIEKFRQILPVVRVTNWFQIVRAFFRQSRLFLLFKRLKLY